MNVNNHPVSVLFNPEANIIYQIPKYQREYTWTSWQWDKLFDDLTDNRSGYFLGSIICVNKTKDQFSSLIFEVVDGQQRLTTISLLLAAIYSAFQKKLAAEELNEDQKDEMRLLRHKLVLKRTPDQSRVVPQTQNNNFEDYRAILSSMGLFSSQHLGAPKHAGNRRIKKAFVYFEKCIEQHLEREGRGTKALIELLDKVNQANVVMIEVSNNADAYTLFESLNNRGMPLTAIDLLKNKLLAELDSSSRDATSIDDYFDKWTQLLGFVGDDYTTQERFFRHNYNAFRRDINAPFRQDSEPDRLFPLASIAMRSNLLEIYEKVIDRDPKAFIDELMINARLYSKLLLPYPADNENELTNTLLDLYRCQGTPSHLLMLFLLKNQIVLQLSDSDLATINRLMVNFFVRRNLTDVPATRDLTRIFMALVEKIEDEHLKEKHILELIRDRLISCSSVDQVFEERLRGPVYKDNYGMTRFILCMLAKEGMTRESMVDLWKQTEGKHHYLWTVEHIFPQGEKIPTCWVDMIADGDEGLAKERQQEFAHTFGNLTMSAYNSDLGNKPFAEKKEKKDAHGRHIGLRNGLNLNKDVVDCEEWTVGTILNRTDRLVDGILALFRL